MSDPDSPVREGSQTAGPEPGAAATPPGSKGPPPRRGRFGPFGAAVGIFVLLLLAAAGGGLAVLYWPWMTGRTMGATADRLGTLERRVDLLSAGQAQKTAGPNLDDLQRNLAALKVRIDAGEARLAALEASGGQPGGEGSAPFQAALDKNAADLTALSGRVDKLDQALAAGPNPQLAAQIDANEKALASLRSDFDARTKTQDDAVDKLDGRIAVLEKNAPPADLAEQLNSFALKSGVAALDVRIGRLEDQDTAGLMRRAASMLALADLVRATSREEPFDDELNALKALIPASRELADLSKHARTGAPTVASLTAQFHQNIDTVLAAERASRAKNWLEKTWYDFINLVSVRRVGNVPGNDTESRLARAEFALKSKDLAAAVAEVRALDKPAKAAIARWLARAEARLAVDRDTRALTIRAVSALAAAGAAAKIAPQPPSDAAK